MPTSPTLRLSWSPRALIPAALLAGAAGLVLGAVVLGGSPGAFVDVPALLVVAGGTLAVTASSYAPAELAQAGRSVAAAFGAGPPPVALLAEAAVRLAEAGRRDGLLSLDRRLGDLAPWPVLRRGLELAIDGVPAEAVGRTLRPAVEVEAALHVRAVLLLRRAADVAPAMGLVGTLVGLVQMLGSLDRPDAIGPAMAVALLTTLYGAMIAHMLLLPLAERVAGLAARVAECRELEAELARAITAGENPRRLRDRLAPLPAGVGAAGPTSPRSGRPGLPGLPAGELP